MTTHSRKSKIRDARRLRRILERKSSATSLVAEVLKSAGDQPLQNALMLLGASFGRALGDRIEKLVRSGISGQKPTESSADTSDKGSED